MLALSQLALSHFRSHKRAVLEVDTRPIAIYGANGAGKTNLLEAVSLDHDLRRTRQRTAGADR